MAMKCVSNQSNLIRLNAINVIGIPCLRFHNFLSHLTTVFTPEGMYVSASINISI